MQVSAIGHQGLQTSQNQDSACRAPDLHAQRDCRLQAFRLELETAEYGLADVGQHVAKL